MLVYFVLMENYFHVLLWLVFAILIESLILKWKYLSQITLTFIKFLLFKKY